MDSQIWAAIINAFTTIIVSSYIYFLVTKKINAQKHDYDLELARLMPSNNVVFEQTREYLQIIKKIKTDFIDYYYTFPYRSLIFIDYLLEKIKEPGAEEYEAIFTQDKVLQNFPQLLQTHRPFLALYLANINSEESKEYRRQSQIIVESYKAKIPLIIPEICEDGERLMELLLSFEKSQQFIQLILEMENSAKSNNELRVELNDFFVNFSKEIEDLYTSLEESFYKKYQIH